MALECFFKGCLNPALPNSWKCQFHRYRDKCHVQDCSNHATSHGQCISHGGRKICSYPDCYANVRTASLCYKHSGGAKKKARCDVEGCTKFAHARHKCVAHGGGRLCSMEGCRSQSRNGGYCQRHGGSLRKCDFLTTTIDHFMPIEVSNSNDDNLSYCDVEMSVIQLLLQC